MARIPGIRRLFRLPSSEEGVKADVEREIAFHVEQRTQELIARGAEPEAARVTALAEFGDVQEAKVELEQIGRRRLRHVQRAGWWSDLGQDLRYGARSLVHAPLFSIVAIVTLALGIGANAAVFGVVKSVLLDRLPYTDADRLARVYGRLLDGSQDRAPLSAGTVDTIVKRQRSFERLTAYVDRTNDAIYGGDVSPRVVQTAWVEPGFFDTLGVSAALGRTFRPEDATSGLVPLSGQAAADTARAVLVTHTAWQQLFNGDPGLLGRDVRLNGTPRSVIGVLPQSFIGPMGDADFYFAFDLAPVVADPIAVWRSQWLGVIGRLQPSVSNDAAQRDLVGIASDLVREHPRDNGNLGVLIMPLRDAMVGDTRTPLLVLLASATLVLLIACANIASTLLSRTISRRKEFAVRIALGAGRGRLVRQLLTESTLLAVSGGTAGLLLASFVLSYLRRLSLPALPDYADLSLDGGGLVATSLVAMCTGMAFGIAPALTIGRSNTQETLRDDTRGASESRHSRRLRAILVAGQMALCLSLLAGAGLLVRSLWAMTSAPLGVDPNGVLTANMQLPLRDYPTAAARSRFLEQLTARLRALPGVDAAATATSVPTTVRSRASFAIERVPWPEDTEPFVLIATVSDDYFRTLQIPLRGGRIFDARDRADSPPTVIISESMARRYWPGGAPIGARIRMGANLKAPFLEIIGVVGDVRNDPARADAEPMAYRSSQQASAPFASVLVRTQRDPLGLVRLVERELSALDTGLALQRPMTLSALIAEQLVGRRLPVLLMTAFGALALLLASVGVYAVFDALASAREREFGVRMALGSQPAAIAALVLKQSAWWISAGLIGGAFGILLVARLLREVVYGVPPFDPLAIGAAVAILIGSATLALLIPLRRAVRVDPATALRAQ
jgi:putative ABC transport system permease protein